MQVQHYRCMSIMFIKINWSLLTISLAPIICDCFTISHSKCVRRGQGSKMWLSCPSFAVHYYYAVHMLYSSFACHLFKRFSQKLFVIARILQSIDFNWQATRRTFFWICQDIWFTRNFKAHFHGLNMQINRENKTFPQFILVLL